ncbi:hypothetical protein SKAU_G00161060 [Synaphobranchus kaupii]|uniref:Uncharacterized protein n=1 Tax=Synaphobranchus kaupii TaxID=118154 RepID=A0A9Q1IYW5_SYNKA|nr:hypothetical protein SKAU_G00161060 [Synaphobranchus kaupii]
MRPCGGSQFAQELRASEVHNSQRGLEKPTASGAERASFQQPLGISRTKTTAPSPDKLPGGTQYLQTLVGAVGWRSEGKLSTADSSLKAVSWAGVCVNEPAGRSPSLEQTLAEEPCPRCCQATLLARTEPPLACVCICVSRQDARADAIGQRKRRN